MKKRILKYISLVLCPIVLCMLLFGCVYWQYFRQLDTKSKSVKLNDAYNTATQPLEDGLTTEQRLTYQGQLYAVGLVFHMVNTAEPGQVRVFLEDERSGQLLLDQTIAFSQITQDSYSCFWLDEPLPDGDHQLRIVAQAAYEDPSTANKLTLYKSDQAAEGFGELTENGAAAPGSLAVLAICELLGSSISKAYWVLAAVVSLLSGALCLLLFGGFARRKYMVFLLVLLVGLIYQCILPPFSAPDELTHYNSAYRISNKWLGIGDPAGTVHKRECDTVEAFTDFHTSAYTYRYILQHFWDSADGQDALVPCQEEYLEGYQLPRLIPAVGITVARLLGWGGILTAYFARFLCLAVYAAFAALACHWLPGSKMGLAVTALLPIAIHLGGSYSYDSLLLGLAFVMIALCLHLTFEGTAPDIKKLVLIALLCIAIAPLKSVYITMPLFVLLIPQKAIGSKGRALIYKLGTVGAAFAHFGCYNLGFIRYSVTAPAAAAAVETAVVEAAAIETAVVEAAAVEAAVQAAAAPALYTVPYLLSHPGILFNLVLNTFFNDFTAYFRQLFGGNLGYLNLAEVRLNILLVFGFVLLWLLAALPEQEDRIRLAPRHRLFCACVFLLTLGLLIAGCITWTPSSYNYIWGFQGRYLLPVLPCLMLAIRPGRIIRTGPNDALVLGAVWTLHVMTVLNILTVILSR